MATGKIGVTAENIFPIIKKFLYSDHEIFLRELISNAVDATQKLKAMSGVGDYKGELGDITIRVSIDNKKKTITVSDKGIGMTAEEVEKYINQIAFSSAEEFLSKYKNQVDAIIGHFGLGFYSAFMVSKKVELITKSYQEGAKAVKWTCDGSPEYTLEETEKNDRGTDVILYIDDESKEFLEENRISDILRKYCKFLPVPIAFGKIKDWKDGKEIETDKDNIINNVSPLWTKKPTEVKEEEYKNFYKELYPYTFEEPLFNIHLNVDYPFNLTGILYFPRIKSNLEIQKNKIQLYCNQVFVTDSVEGIVPEFLTLLHGVIDSPDIPLNVSRSYLQSDSNVKKISSHITKKVADKLQEIFKTSRDEFEKKWDDLKLFIEYGMITDEKFYEKAEKFVLLKNTESKYFTLDEYEKIIKDNQTDKNKTLVYLYATDKEAQHSFIESAKNKGYDILLCDGQLDIHFINYLETKLKNCKFVRIDSNIIDRLIEKEDKPSSWLTEDEKEELRPVFEGVIENSSNFYATFEDMNENDFPVTITQSEFMRRMKDMSKLGGGMYGFYGEMPDQYNLIINTNHALIKSIIEKKNNELSNDLKNINNEIAPLKNELDKLEEAHSKLKYEEIKQEEKDRKEELNKKINELKDKKKSILVDFAKHTPLVKELIDLALLSNNMLKGEDLTKFVKRSIELIK
jgi:molecular chaperone HtpG